MNIGSSILKHSESNISASSNRKLLPMLTLDKSPEDPASPQLKQALIFRVHVDFCFKLPTFTRMHKSTMKCNALALHHLWGYS